MKILWHSVAPWTPSGYGVQTDLFTRRIRAAGHDVRISAIFGLEGNIREVDGFTVYPTDITRYGKQMLKLYAKDFGEGNADDVQIVTLMDVWTWINTNARCGGIVADWEGLRIAAWVPVDHDPAPPLVLEALDRYKAQPIAMTRFGESQLREHGFDPLYVPHGVDTEVYRPHDDPRALKEKMGLDPDVFVVGMVGANMQQNPPRKAFPQVFQAFAQFHAQHPDTFLYLHCETLGMYEGINLLHLAQACGIPAGAYGGVAQDKYLVGTVTGPQMAGIYSIMDVLANPSYGEGFGVPIIEAQACGVPVIVTDWTSMPELCGAGWKVQGDRWWDSFHASFFMCPSVYEIVDAFEQAYEARDDYGLKAKAREFALQYDADLVMADYWTPTLARLDAPREVGPLPNRAMRRAKKTKVAA
jgi:glycosyltransferase involved in cell wall biosynthesis